MSYILEACVDSVESAIAAKKGGADRLELCGNLIIGGTTPSIELFNEINRNIDIPSNILIRPRFGDFCYTDYEFNIIKKEVELFKQFGANGVVVGVLKKDGHLDLEKMRELMRIAEGIDVTLHRAFDVCKDPYKTLEEVQELGIKTILTSGQKNTAIESVEFLDDLQSKADKVDIMAGSGVNLDVVKEFLKRTRLKSYHLSGKKVINSKMEYKKDGVPMGLPMMSEFEIWVTDENIIKSVRTTLDEAV